MPLSQANNRLYTRSSQLVGQTADGLDIDGLDDIGEAIADADLFIIDNGGGGTNTKTAVTRIPTYVFSGISGQIAISSSGVASFATNAEATNLTLSGNLTVNGDTVSVNTTTVTVDDPMFALADNNSADTVDIGWYGKYVDSGTKYSGLFRDASDSDMWKLFSATGNSHEAPSTTVNTTSGFTLANLSVNELTGTIATAAQANITSLGTLSALTVDDVAVDGKAVTMTGSSGDTAVLTVGTNGTLDITTTDTDAAAANIQITADGTAELAGTTVTLDSEGGITLDANGGTITFADDGASLGTITSSGYSGTSAVATLATTVTITDNEDTDEDNAVIFTAGGDVDGGNLGLESDGTLTYNPSSGTLTSTTFAGNLTGNASGSAATVTTAAQTNITSLGTLTGLTLDGDKSVTPGDGAMIHVDTSTITDSNTSGSGTAARYAHIAIEAPTLAATNSSVTTSDVATVYINNAATAGTNQTITRNWGLWLDAGNARFDGSIYSGTTEALSSAGLVTVANQSNITGVGTISSGTWEATDIAVAHGGTGASTATAGFDALSPMTAEGDILYGGSSGTVTKLAKGSDADVLTLASGVPSWATPTTGDITGVTAGNGLSGGGTSGGVSLALDLSELTDTAIANGDYIVFTDTTDSNATVKGDLADVATLFAGTGLTASSSVIGVDASQTQITAVGTIATGTWEATDIAVAHGGTGASSLTANAILTGNGTSAIQAETDLLFSSNKLIPTATAHNAAGTALTMSAGTTTAGTTNNIAGGALTFQGGQGKGSGAGGAIIFQTANAGGSGSSLNALATALTINDDLSITTGGTIELGHASDTTIARSGSGDITIEGNAVYRAGGTDVPVADGGTGQSNLNNLITMGTHTTGNYVATITAGTGLTSDGATSGESIAHSLSVDASQTQITAVGTIATGVWQGTAIASAYLDSDTAHLSGTQTFSGAKTFTSTITVGVDDTGQDVKFFGASAGAYMEWDESADQLRIMGASADATTSTGKLLLATSLTDINANDVLGKVEFQAPHEAGGTDAITVAASIEAVAQGTFSSSVNATDILFKTGHSEAATEKFRFTSQGEIGIGGTNYGTSGQLLTSGGAGAAPSWADAAGGGGTFTATANGAISAGDRVALRSDGDVETCEALQAGKLFGTAASTNATEFETGNTYYQSCSFDPDNNKIGITYRDAGNSNYPTIALGHITNAVNATVAIGTPVVVESVASSSDFKNMPYDTAADRFVSIYSTSAGIRAVVWTVNDAASNTITKGSAQAIDNSNKESKAVYDTNAGRVVAMFDDADDANKSKAVAFTVRGGVNNDVQDIGALFDIAGIQVTAKTMVYDANDNKVNVFYANSGDSDYPYVVALTVDNSDNSITKGTAVRLTNETAVYGLDRFPAIHDSIANANIAINESATGDDIESWVWTCSSGVITAGGHSVDETIPSGHVMGNYGDGIFDPDTGKIIYFAAQSGIFVLVGSISGTGADAVFTNESVTRIHAPNGVTGGGNVEYLRAFYDTNSNKSGFVFKNTSGDTGNFMLIPVIPKNATNFIGFSNDAVSNGATATITTSGGVATGQSSLTIGSEYYVNSLGALTTTSGTIFAGKALTATTLLVNPPRVNNTD